MLLSEMFLYLLLNIDNEFSTTNTSFKSLTTDRQTEGRLWSLFLWVRGSPKYTGSAQFHQLFHVSNISYLRNLPITENWTGILCCVPIEECRKWNIVEFLSDTNFLFINTNLFNCLLFPEKVFQKNCYSLIFQNIHKVKEFVNHENSKGRALIVFGVLLK